MRQVIESNDMDSLMAAIEKKIRYDLHIDEDTYNIPTTGILLEVVQIV